MIPLGNLLGGVVSNHIQSIDISIGIRNGVAAIFDMLFFCKEVVKMNLLLPQNPRKIGVAAFIEKLFRVKKTVCCAGFVDANCWCSRYLRDCTNNWHGFQTSRQGLLQNTPMKKPHRPSQKDLADVVFCVRIKLS